ncbi:peptide ABC transporter substrate-binding protein [Mesorhizobium sp. M0663]|uniref:ABC transporter substrate-binding protein n=1 Tax=Mesorhizobium sp. M0663 TaxID=2956981 RepID=UPI00333A336D
MNSRLLNRRTVVKAVLLGSVSSWLIGTRTFALSCGDQIVRIGGAVAPDSMNPFATYGAFYPLFLTYDFLVGVDAQRHEDRKGFAQSWSVADDKLTWTFKLWPKMQWSDGHPATANDVAFTYNYLRKSIGAPDELNAGWNNVNGLEQIKSVTAVDDETLQIVTNVPTRWPADNIVMIVPEHIWKDVSYAEARSTFRNDPPLVGTGPMIVQEFEQGQFARLAPNPYFRTGKPATNGMIFSFFNNADPIAQGLKSGSLDYGMSLTAAQWTDLSTNSDVQVGQSRIEQRNYLAFNTASGEGAGSTKALQDPAFRDAVGYAIDQKLIVDRAFRGHADPGVGVVMTAASQYYSDLSDIQRHFDLTEAARRLDAAGYKDSDGDGIREDKGGKPFQLELITGNPAGNIEIPIAAVELIAGWLGQIGIPVSVTQLDPGAIQARTAVPAKGGGGWDLLVISNWLTSNPGDLVVIGKSGDRQNRSYWKNEKFDKLVSAIDVAVDLEKSKALIDQAARLIYTEAPYIMLCYPFQLDARRKDCFQGWGDQDIVSVNSYFPFDRLRPI